MTGTRLMTIDDYAEAYHIWSESEGMVLSDADSLENIRTYLDRNVGLSLVYEDDKKVIGTILCGHDGRRGYIYHVAVRAEYRNKGIGKELVNRSLEKLGSIGISKCHIFVVADNEIGNRFWNYTGWTRREGILIYSKST